MKKKNNEKFWKQNLPAFLMVIILLLLVWSIFRERSNKKLLEGKTKNTIAFIYEINSGKGVRQTPGVKYFYYVKGKKIYYRDNGNFNSFKNGDTVLIKYSVEKPSVSEVVDRYYMKKYHQVKEVASNSKLNVEWEEYVESSKRYSFKSTKIDSLVIYQMKMEAPEVISKDRIILWKNGNPLKSDLFTEFDQMTIVDSTHFVFSHFRKRSLSISELSIAQNDLKIYSQKLLDLNSEKSLLHDPCNEISAVNQKKVQNKIILEIEIHNTCYSSYQTTELTYSLKN